MYESSAQYVVGSRPKARRPGGTATSALHNLRSLLSQRKWQFVIGLCFVLSVAAVALPASAARSAKRASSRRPAAAPVHNTVAQNEAADEPRAVFNAPAVNKKALARKPSEHHVAKARKAAPVAAPKKRRRTASPTRKPPNIAEEKEREEEAEKGAATKEAAADEPEAPAVQDAPAVAAPAAAAKEKKEKPPKSRTTKASQAVVDNKNVAAHRESAPPPSNESIFRFATPSFPNDAGDHNVEDIRLPRTVKPITYKLVLVPEYQDQSMSFKGSVRITLEALAPTKLIQLHAANLVINRGNLSLRFSSGSPGPDILSIRTNDFSQFLYINLAEDLLAGDKYELNIPFSTVAMYDNGFNVRRYQREEGPPV